MTSTPLVRCSSTLNTTVDTHGAGAGAVGSSEDEMEAESDLDNGDEEITSDGEDA